MEFGQKDKNKENEKSVDTIGTIPAQKTDSEKTAKKEEKAKNREAKSKAFDVIKKFVDEKKNDELTKALQTVRPSLYGISSPRAGGGGSSIADKFIALVSEKGSVSEDVVFKELKVGRKDCAGFIRKSLKRAMPENRVWISFDIASGLYKKESKGATPPANWKGFVPVDESIDLSGTNGLK